MRCLIIDNYDSFTWNLADYVSQIYGEEPLVIYNDQYTWDEICSLQEFGSIIISPGPGSVVNHGDFQVSRHALEQNDIPVLGVCLGMQGLAHIYGARIEAAPVPYHGRTSTIRHHGGALFEGIPAGFEAVRYHSLCVARESVPPSLRVTAQLDCGLVMALEHTRHPKWGVQFHPESILSEHGIQLMSNFRNLAYRHAGVAVPAPRTMVGARGLAPHAETAGQALAVTRKRLLSRKIDRLADAEAVFLKLYAEQEHCFWLDSQNVIDGMSRYSFMGAVNKEQVLTYRNGSPDKGPGAGEDFIATLDQYLEATKVEADTELPFEFRGGYVGFMTYEMRAVFGQTVTKTNLLPDAIWMRAERFIAFDHVSGAAWLLGIDDPAHPGALQTWMDDTEARLAVAVAGAGAGAATPAHLGLDALDIDIDFNRDQYIAAIARCKEKIVAGESYEICLTNHFSFELALDPVKLYLLMRRENAAPFGAFIKSRDYSVLSTSPERFLKVERDGVVQTKPIKGTCPRSDDAAIDRSNAAKLAASEKDRAENLMIVDLMRNDLGRVAVPGSVVVSKLMGIESYRTMHQMVSTVDARLKASCTLVDLLRAIFPGGSISGAPKQRTLDIIDQLELAPRGVYCGTIGYLGYNRVADLNIAIRSLSYDGTSVQFGAGGAITYLSDPQAEFDEVLLKAESILRPIWHYVSSSERRLLYRLAGNTMRL